MQGKVALVTGSGLGIGRASAMLFASAGARVVVADISEEHGAETVDRIRKLGGEAEFCRADVTSNSDVMAMVAFTVERFGRLDYAHNNAGGALIPFRSIVDASEEDWDRVVEFNLKSAFLCMKHEVIHMLAHGGGAIVNTASAASYRGSLSPPAYTAAKHGLIGLTRAASIEVATKNIRINAICPSTTLTEGVLQRQKGLDALEARVRKWMPMERVLSAAEVAQTAVWVCSDEASAITGAVLAVDGGVSAI
jgi:NAD(P)-dependent dehydrogenase (short-subunit alcohol dehydrogenase family)